MSEDPLTTFFFEDTGAPENAGGEYTTIFLVSGAVYQSTVFQRLLPQAKKYGVRLVALTQRNFPGSSPFTEEELKSLTSSDNAVRADAIQAVGREIATFMAAFVEKHNIPPTTKKADGTTFGGISILCWSASNILIFSLLVRPDKLPARTIQVLNTHLRSAVIFDPPKFTIGEHPEELREDLSNPSSGLWMPHSDPTLSLQQLMDQFPSRVSSYFTAVDTLPSGSPADLEQTLALLRKRQPVHLDPAEQADAKDKTPTVERMTAAEIASMDWPEYWTSPYPPAFLMADPSIYKNHFQLAMKMSNKVENGYPGPAVLPNLKLILMWCNMSVGETVSASAFLVDRYNTMKEGGEKVRPLEVIKVPGSNHLIHWDEPERFVQILAKSV